MVKQPSKSARADSSAGRGAHLCSRDRSIVVASVEVRQNKQRGRLVAVIAIEPRDRCQSSILMIGMVM
jgi:hypothetical protein